MIIDFYCVCIYMYIHMCISCIDGAHYLDLPRITKTQPFLDSTSDLHSAVKVDG